MARTLVEQTRCDVCDKAGSVQSYTINKGSVAVVVDLCDSDSRTLDGIMRAGSTGPRRRAPAKPDAITHRVVPID